MQSHHIEIRMIAGDGSWRYSWGADTGADPNLLAAAARAYVSVLAAAASGAWPAENVKAMVDRTGREFPMFDLAHSHGDVGNLDPEPLNVAAVQVSPEPLVETAPEPGLSSGPLNDAGPERLTGDPRFHEDPAADAAGETPTNGDSNVQ